MLNTCLVTHLLLLLLLNLGVLNVRLYFVIGCHEAEREALLTFKQSLIGSDLFIDIPTWPLCTDGKDCNFWKAGIGCHDDDDDYYTNPVLPSWEGKDCCTWLGVGCDNVTSYVNRLDLHNPQLNYNNVADQIVASKLDQSLLELRHLKYLDLSGNNFLGSSVPGFIGTFKHLTHLNLSTANFGGVIPSQLGNLTKLRVLDLSTMSSGYQQQQMLSSDFHWASTLVSLRYLNIGGINISKTSNSMHAFTMLPSLLDLRLSSCGLYTSHLFSLFSNSTWLSKIQQLDFSNNMLEFPFPQSFTNMTSLKYLDLSSNSLNRSIPVWMENMRKLEHFNISHNSLGGTLPNVFANLTYLKYLSLSSINLTGSIPLWVRNMKELEHLDVSHNSLNRVEGGSIMGILGSLCHLKSFDLSYNYVGSEKNYHSNLSKCVSYDLEILRLKANMIRGSMPSLLWKFTKLRVLDISQNRIDDHIPISIESLSYLKKLDLSDNSLKGVIPYTLAQCKALVFIDLSSNSLQGALSELHLSSLSRLKHLDLSFNPNLELNLNSNWLPPFQLVVLRMSSCKVQIQFPRWTVNQTNLKELDLSNNNISGDLPEWFSSKQLSDINISHNQITGPVPYFSSQFLDTVDLSYNLLSGSILHDDPSTKHNVNGSPLCQLPYLEFLDIAGNRLVGAIPDCWCLFGNHSFLMYINLSFNKLSGNIPISMGLLTDLAFLKLSYNSLEGPIPPTLGNRRDLEILDLGENKLVGNIPVTWGAESYFRMIILRGNQLSGPIPQTLCSLPKLQLIDFADNNLTGGIPACLGQLISMKSAPYYGYSDISDWTPIIVVVLKGIGMSYRTTLKYVINLDLSCNALVGSIPDEITNLSTLIGLNLSHNHLMGYIPENIGEMISLESIDLSNNNLSGTIPSSISALTSLITLNLSYNNLHGQIPTGRQLQTLNDTSSYEGNPGLCGDPLPNKCTNSGSKNQPQQEQEDPEEENNWEKPLFYFDIFSGFATGFWGVVGCLLLRRRFRWALFQLVGNITDYLYVQVMIKLNRHRN